MIFLHAESYEDIGWNFNESLARWGCFLGAWRGKGKICSKADDNNFEPFKKIKINFKSGKICPLVISKQ